MSNHRRPPSGGMPNWATWTQSIINGAVGDYLHHRQNGLLIEMAFYAHNRPLPLTRAAIRQVHPQPTGRIVLLVHGLGCHEGMWAFPDPDCPDRIISYGTALQADFGYTPFFLRYNTGLALAENGRRLAALLNDLLAAYPLPVTEIMLIGHSMGGLVIRHACHTGVRQHAAWVHKIRQIFYLGSPHDGAPLARLGHAAAKVLHAVPHPITNLVGSVINIRSQGVKDLRAGPQSAEENTAPQALPWLESARHYLIVGMLAGDTEHVVTALFGDGLVPVPGSPAHHPFELRCFPHTNHMQLAYDPPVYRQIRQWHIEYERNN